MRVLMMMSSIAMGGAERNIVSVLPYMKAAGIEPILCTLNKRRDSPLAAIYEQTGLPRLDVGAKRMTDPAAWKRFGAILRNERIDLIHTQDQDTHVYGALARRRFGLPVVMTRHVMVEPAETLKTKLRAQLVLWAGKYGATKIVAVSEVVRQQFAQQSHVPISKIETIYNGIESEKFNTRQQRDEIRTSLDWKADAPVIIMVAVMRPGKGHELLFQAAPRLREAFPTVQIKLVGDGERREEFMAQAAPLKDHIEFLGQRTDIPDLLGASDVLVLPSWSEALPTVLIEAGAAALPVVATNVGGTPEIVEDGIGGYIIPSGDTTALADRLIDVLRQPDKAAQMGIAAQQRVLKVFSLPRQAEQTINLYERVLNHQ